MNIDHVRRIDLGTFVRPPEETGTGQPRIEAVCGYLVRTPAGLLILDTGLGKADAETDAWVPPAPDRPARGVAGGRRHG